LRDRPQLFGEDSLEVGCTVGHDRREPNPTGMGGSAYGCALLERAI
jgi:hypothetical protein